MNKWLRTLSSLTFMLLAIMSIIYIYLDYTYIYMLICFLSAPAFLMYFPIVPPNIFISLFVISFIFIIFFKRDMFKSFSPEFMLIFIIIFFVYLYSYTVDNHVLFFLYFLWFSTPFVFLIFVISITWLSLIKDYIEKHPEQKISLKFLVNAFLKPEPDNENHSINKSFILNSSIYFIYPFLINLIILLGRQNLGRYGWHLLFVESYTPTAFIFSVIFTIYYIYLLTKIYIKNGLFHAIVFAGVVMSVSAFLLRYSII